MLKIRLYLAITYPFWSAFIKDHLWALKYDTTFLDITIFGKIAETTNEYCQKGDILGIEYIVKNHNWEDEEGKKKIEGKEKSLKSVLNIFLKKFYKIYGIDSKYNREDIKKSIKAIQNL